MIDNQNDDGISYDFVSLGIGNFDSNIRAPMLRSPTNVANKLYLGDGRVIDPTDTKALKRFSASQFANFKFDDLKFVEDKFKSKPITQAEVRDCETTLTRKELKSLLFGPKVEYQFVCV